MKRMGIAVVAVSLLAAACSGTEESTGTTIDVSAPESSAPSTDPDPEQAPGTDPPSTEPPAPSIVRPAPAPADEETLAAITAAVDAAPAGCDPLDTRQCVLPYPSNATTIVDASAATGLRVAFPAGGLPANAAGARFDPTEWNRNDGFSPNATLLTHVPGLDHDASNLPSWTDLGASLAPDANVVMVDLADGERVPLWAERDTKATDPDDELLVVQPAIGLR